MKKILEVASSIQNRIFGRACLMDYIWLMILAILPTYLSARIGIARTLFVRVGTTTAACAGYWDRYNWISLVVLSPTALWLARVIADLLFALSRRFGGYTRIPDLIPGGNDLARAGLVEEFAAGSNFIVAFFLTSAITLIDMWDTLAPYADSVTGTIQMSTAPSRWDWSLWFLSRPSDHSLYWNNLWLVLVAYASQFAITFFAISVIVFMLKHNLFYLKSIYLRRRSVEYPARPMVALDFDARDRCFGFHSLFMVFNVQLLVLALAGGFTLVSRASNSNTTPMSTCLAKLTSGEFKFSEFWGAVFENLTTLFPTAGQRLFPIIWLIMFGIVLLPALAKLLPIPQIFRKNPVDARDYLLQFMPPDSPRAVSSNDLNKVEDVDEASKKFSQQSFWPVSQTSAEFFSVAAFFVFFLVLAPVFTWHMTVGHFLFYGLLLMMSFASSAALFAAFRYMLRTVDPRLIGQEKN